MIRSSSVQVPDSDEVLLILLCGGMKNAWLSAFLAASRLQLKNIHAIWASSSAAIAGLYYLAGQHELTRQKWVEVLTRRQVFHVMNIATDLACLRRPWPGKIEYLVEQGCDGLDWPAVWRSHVDFRVGAFSLATGETHYIPLTDENSHPLLLATLSPPLIAHPTLVPDYGWMRDGGTAVILPVGLAYQAGYRRIIVIANEPVFQSRYPRGLCDLAARLDPIPWSPEARRAMWRRPEQLEEDCALLATPTDGPECLVCKPAAPLSAQTLTRSPRLVEEAFVQGEKDGAAQRSAIEEFFQKRGVTYT
jgi:predicted patatin/cPLA2 family phospholipase